MSRKKTKKTPEKLTTKRGPKGRNRAEVVLLIVATDNTFVPIVGRPVLVDEFAPRQQLGWMGRCIHCNSHVYVSIQGATVSTIEHIKPLCDGGHPTDPRNLGLACKRCNNEKGVRHDQHAGKGGRADEVIATLQAKRAARWRDPPSVQASG